MKFKKSILTLASLAAAIAPIASVVACGSHNTTDQVATIVTDPENERWQKADKAFASTGSKLFGADIEHAILKTQEDQNNWLNARLGKKSYILGTTDDSVASFIKKINDTTKAPIIAYDKLIDVNSPNYNWYVAYDNAKIGNIQGLAIIKNLYNASDTDIPWTLNLSKPEDVKKVTDFVEAHKLTTKDVILAVAGDPKDNNARLFYSGAQDILNAVKAKDPNFDFKNPDFETIAQEGWDYNKGKSYLTTAIGQLSTDDKKNLKAILCPNDLMAVTGAIPALESSNLKPTDIYLTGLDANVKGIDSIREDTGLNMTINKPDSWATEAALNLAKELIVKPDLTAAEATEKLNADCPDLKGKWTVDETSYKTIKAKPEKVIKTILFTPIPISKANLSDLKD